MEDNPLHNLTNPLTSFVGREVEKDEVQRLLSLNRLVSLLGPGGCGKTRLAVEVGWAVLTDAAAHERFADGVWLVDLSQIHDPELVAQAAATALGITTQAGNQLETVFLDFLRRRRLLLILDNCEHVIDEISRLCMAILGQAPGAQILATSQIPLGLPGEMEWLVPSLPLPENGAEPQDLKGLMAFGAVQLFVDRARTTLPGFSLTSENARAVVEICRRLDGIPLAIELAVTRVKMMSVEAIAARMDDRFSLLNATRRGVLPRHQTLAAAVDWSYGLLSNKEQLLLNRLGIFAGPWTLEAAMAVCGDPPGGGDEVIIDPAELLDLLASLIDHSLVFVNQPAVSRQKKGETNYRLLETIRLFALSRLSETDQAIMSDRLLAWCDRYTTELSQEIEGPLQAEGFSKIEADLPNLRAAVDWAIAHPPPDRRFLQGLRIAAQTAWALRTRGQIETSYRWLAEMLGPASVMDDPDWIDARAAAHLAQSRNYWLRLIQTQAYEQAQASQALYRSLGDAGQAGEAYARLLLIKNRPFNDPMPIEQECFDLLAQFRALGETRGEIELLNVISNMTILEKKQYQAGEGFMFQALELAHQTRNTLLTGWVSRDYAKALADQKRWEEIPPYLEEGRRCFEALGFIFGLSLIYLDLGENALFRGMLEPAQDYFRQNIAYAERTGTKWLQLMATYYLGIIDLRQAQEQAAAVKFRQVIWDRGEAEHPTVVAYALRGLAAIIAAADPRQAARLEGYAAALIAASEDDPYLVDSVVVMPRIMTARQTLGEAAFAKCAAEGAGISLETLLSAIEPARQSAAISRAPAQALEGQPGLTSQPHPLTALKAEKARFSGLTSREREVAVYIAQGLSNLAIARAMMLSERTVTTHVTHILSKLGFSARTQVAAWAVEKGLYQTEKE